LGQAERKRENNVPRRIKSLIRSCKGRAGTRSQKAGKLLWKKRGVISEPSRRKRRKARCAVEGADKKNDSRSKQQRKRGKKKRVGHALGHAPGKKDRSGRPSTTEGQAIQRTHCMPGSKRSKGGYHHGAGFGRQLI